MALTVVGYGINCYNWYRLFTSITTTATTINLFHLKSDLSASVPKRTSEWQSSRISRINENGGKLTVLARDVLNFQHSESTAGRFFRLTCIINLFTKENIVAELLRCSARPCVHLYAY